MNELIRIQERDGKKAVSARDLHEFLESRQDFSTWIKNRIDKYDLVENVDYQVFHNIVGNSNGGRPLIEYALSVDAAKELSMVEGNEKGKQARRYFIECEKIAQQTAKPLTQIEVLLQSVQMLAEQDKRIGKVENKVLEIEARTKTRPDYLTVVGYATLKKIQCGLQLASKLGRKATSICNVRGYQMEEIPDPRFGRVKTYPLSVLEEVFDMPVN